MLWSAPRRTASNPVEVNEQRAMTMRRRVHPPDVNDGRQHDFVIGNHQGDHRCPLNLGLVENSGSVALPAMMCTPPAAARSQV